MRLRLSTLTIDCKLTRVTLASSAQIEISNLRRCYITHTRDRIRSQANTRSGEITMNRVGTTPRNLYKQAQRNYHRLSEFALTA